MSPLSDMCQHQGCTEKRSALTVFCDAHHREQLIKFGLLEDIDPIDAARIKLIKKYQRMLRNHEVGAITYQEMISAVRHTFIDHAAAGFSIADGVAIVPHSLCQDLLKDMQANPKAHVWHMAPGPPPERREAFYEARRQHNQIAQLEFQRQLEERMNQT
jgi:hypothetical protein